MTIETEQLSQLQRATWDGDLISKDATHRLHKAGMVPPRGWLEYSVGSRVANCHATWPFEGDLQMSNEQKPGFFATEEINLRNRVEWIETLLRKQHDYLMAGEAIYPGSQAHRDIFMSIGGHNPDDWLNLPAIRHEGEQEVTAKILKTTEREESLSLKRRIGETLRVTGVIVEPTDGHALIYGIRNVYLNISPKKENTNE